MVTKEPKDLLSTSTDRFFFCFLRYNSLVTKKESFQPRSRDETHSITVFDSLNDSYYEYFENFHLKYDMSKGRHNQRQLSLYHSGKNGENPIPIVLLVGDRVQYIQTTLEKLSEAEGIQDAPIFISRTSTNQSVTELCNHFSLSQVSAVLLLYYIVLLKTYSRNLFCFSLLILKTLYILTFA